MSNILIRCICFSRVSTVHQDLVPQRDAIMAEALKNYKKDEIIEVSGKESAIKLKEDERQTLNEMKELVEQYSTIESIYFFAVDRLARRISVVMSIKEWADSKKINLVFLNPYPFQTWIRTTDNKWKKNEISDVYLMFLGFGAKMEMEIKQERFAAARKLLRAQNKPVGSKILFGYKKDENRNVVIDPETAKIVKWVFECCNNKDWSTCKIYDEGVENGYFKPMKSRSAKANRIAFILRNRAYFGADTGTLIYPAIVTQSEVENAVERLKMRKFKSKTLQKHIYLCKGFIKDEDTGLIMIADIGHVQYVSRDKNNIKRFAININVADSCIWKTASDTKFVMVSNDGDGQIALTKKQLNEISVKIQSVTDYINNDITPKYDRAYNAFVNAKGRISEDMYKQTIATIDLDMSEAENKKRMQEQRELELLNLLDELNRKEKIDIDFYTIGNIKDDKQRQDIISETVTGMSVKAMNNNLYIIKVYTRLPNSPQCYIYSPLGGHKRLYMVTGLLEDLSLDPFVPVDETDKGNIIEMTKEIEMRFNWKK